jgi:hypothetical protein
MSRRIIRTVDGQVFSDSNGRFHDGKGEILYKRGFLNTVRINKRSVSSDDISGSPVGVVIGVMVIVFLVVAALSAILLAGRLSSVDPQSGNPKAAKAVSPNSTVNAMPGLTAEVVTDVIVDMNTETYHFLSCAQLEKIEQHHKRTFNYQQAKSLKYKRHKACSK